MPKIISAMQAMGYKLDPDGVCFGLAAMSAKAVIRKDALSFVERIKLIHNANDTFPKTIQKEKQIELQSFFDELSIYQGADSYSDLGDIFPNLQQNIANLELLTSNEELISYSLLNEEEKVSIALPKVKVAFVNNFTFNEFTAFVKKTAKFLNDEPFSLLISESAANHSIQLGFDGSKWLLTDHDHVEICDNTESDVQKLILKFFRMSSSTSEKQKTLSINVILSNFSQTDLTKFDNYDFNVDLLTSSFDEDILFELALNAQSLNKIALLEKLISKIKYIDPTLDLFLQMLNFEDIYGQSILFRAAADGQVEILNLLIEQIENSDLTETAKMDLFGAKDDEGRSIFYYTISEGHIDTARAILEAINKIQLHSRRKDIISSQDLDGTSTIHMAILVGNKELVELVLTAIDGLSISKEQKFELITAKTHEKVSALHIAVSKGHVDIVELLLSSAKQKKVSEKDQLNWITSATLDRRNAFNIAARKGNTTIAKRLFAAIDECNVSIDIKKKRKANLLNFKNERGISASTIAAISGHVEFYRYILDMYKDLYGDTTSSILKLLTQKQIIGATAIFLAIEQGHKEMVNFLIHTIMELGISDSQKAELIEAKHYDGTCALSFAAQQGYTEIVDALLKAIFSLNLPDEEKFRLIDAKNANNASALLLAVAKGDIKTVENLVRSILSCNLSVANKTMLLTSALPKNNLESAYQYALNKKHQQISDYLKTTILNSQIFTKQQKSIILKNQ